MGEPIQKSSAKVVSPDPTALKKKVPQKCDEGEYLDVNQDGKYVCLLDPGPLELMGDGMTCGGKGGFPCDFGQERFGIPKKPQDQFKPAEPKELTRLITGKAEYDCKTQMPHTEHWTIHREVSVRAVSGEPEAKMRARLEQAAMDLAKTIGGCQDVKFLRLQPGAKESAKAGTPSPQTPTPPQIDSMSEFNRLCGPGGKWENRSICRR